MTHAKGACGQHSSLPRLSRSQFMSRSLDKLLMLITSALQSFLDSQDPTGNVGSWHDAPATPELLAAAALIDNTREPVFFLPPPNRIPLVRHRVSSALLFICPCPCLELHGYNCSVSICQNQSVMASRHLVRRQLATIAGSCASTAGRSNIRCYSAAASSNLANGVKKAIQVRVRSGLLMEID